MSFNVSDLDMPSRAAYDAVQIGLPDRVAPVLNFSCFFIRGRCNPGKLARDGRDGKRATWTINRSATPGDRYWLNWVFGRKDRKEWQ